MISWRHREKERETNPRFTEPFKKLQVTLFDLNQKKSILKRSFLWFANNQTSIYIYLELNPI